MASSREIMIRRQHQIDLTAILTKRNAALKELEALRKSNIKQLQYEHDRTVKQAHDDYQRDVYEENNTFKADIDALKAEEAAVRGR